MNLETLSRFTNAASATTRSEPSADIPMMAEWMKSIFGFNDMEFLTPDKSEAERLAIMDQILKQSAIYSPEEGKVRTSVGDYEAGWFIHPTVREILDLVNELGQPEGGLPNVGIVARKDVGMAHVEGWALETFQAASQFNALEMANPDKTPLDGIGIYIFDGTQGPRTALIAAPGTYVRNYWLFRKLGAQFNALENLGLDTVNGYLIWGDNPQSILPKLTNIDQIMIPCMIYTQVAGVTIGDTVRTHVLNKRMHQIYSSAVPVNAYGNSGDYNTQLEIAKKIITAEYIGTIGMGIILHTLDYSAGKVSYPHPKINLTLIGGGVFNVPIDTIFDAILEAINYFPGRIFDLYVHIFNQQQVDQASAKLGNVVPFRYDFPIRLRLPDDDTPISKNQMTTYKKLISSGIPLSNIGQHTPKTVVNYRGEGRNLDVSEFLYTDGSGPIFKPRDYQLEMLRALKYYKNNFIHFRSFSVIANVFRAISMDGQEYLYGFVDETGNIKWFIDSKNLPKGYTLVNEGGNLYLRGGWLNRVAGWPVRNLRDYRVVE